MRKLILVMNGKGGVGKSTFAINFVQFHKDHGLAHAAVDTDNENSTLKRFHPEAVFLEINKPRGLDGLFDLVDANPVVIVDCRAASTDSILNYLTDVDGFSVLSSLGASLVVVSPVTHEPDSIEQVRVISAAIGKRAGYVVVRNRVHGDGFEIYDQSRTRARLLDEFNAVEISLRRLPDWLVTALHLRSISITAAAASGSFSLIDRQRLLNWQREFYGEIKSVGVLLLADSSAHGDFQQPVPVSGMESGGCS
jgi:cellulose biosynthesis protein BcsQ